MLFKYNTIFILKPHSFLYIITFHCCQQIALDFSFNLMYCDLGSEFRNGAGITHPDGVYFAWINFLNPS